MLWVFGENLKHVFDHNWTTSNRKFIQFATNIFQGDATYDGTGKRINQGDSLRQLLKNFDQNENEIKEIVDNINECDHFDFCGIKNHKRFNSLGFAMEESLHSDL